MKNTARTASIVLLITILAADGCSRAGATKGHARGMKPAPSTVRPDSVPSSNSDTLNSAPRVWELTALASNKGPSSTN